VGGGGLAISSSTTLQSLRATNLPPGKPLPRNTTCGIGQLHKTHGSLSAFRSHAGCRINNNVSAATLVARRHAEYAVKQPNLSR
jgi:hypothetical protein